MVTDVAGIRGSTQYQEWAKLSPQDRDITANPILGGLKVTGKAGDVTPSKYMMTAGGKRVLNPNYSTGLLGATSPTTGTNTGSTTGLPTGGTTNVTTGNAGFTGSWTKPARQTPGLLTPPATQDINPDTRQVTADELATSQLDKILGKDSPLAQRANTQGMQYANSRGLLNSGMAAGASFGALVDRATPLAISDADKYSNVADRNLGYTNQFKLSDKEYGQAFNLQKDDQGFKSGENALDRTLTKSENAANRAQDEKLAAMGDTAAMARLQAQQGWQSGESALDRTANITEAEKARAFTSGENQLNRDFDRQTQLTGAELEADAQLTQHLYALDELGVKFDMSQFEVSKTYAANLMGSLQSGIANIAADPNLTPESKDQAVKNLIDTTNDMLTFGSTLYKTNIPTMGGAASTQPTANASFASPVETVSGLYQELMGRNPDPEGLQFWTNVMKNNGWTKDQLRQEMMKAAGYQDYLKSTAQQAIG